MYKLKIIVHLIYSTISSYLPENATFAVMRKIIFRQQCLHMAVVYVANNTHSTGNPSGSAIMSVLVEMKSSIWMTFFYKRCSILLLLLLILLQLQLNKRQGGRKLLCITRI